MRRFLFVTVAVALLTVGGYLLWPASKPSTPSRPQPLWAIRGVDAMKYSRDLAREKASSQSFPAVIETQVAAIAATGATHIAIATPYDAEFTPFLTSWVEAARAHGLSVWFRGNLSGWEKWFDYPAITREQHTRGVVEFIKANASLFENGDIFTACPECENGGPGDPRHTGDVEGFRAFMLNEHKAVAAAFRAIGKNVSINYPSMNYDVATLIMDPTTTEALGGVVGIDHYIKDPHQFAADIREIAAKSQGKVFLGEFGAPIPDIHGTMTGEEQAAWLRTVLTDLQDLPSLVGVNYWVGFGGSTAIWDTDGTPHPAAEVLSEFYHLLR